MRTLSSDLCLIVKARSGLSSLIPPPNPNVSTICQVARCRLFCEFDACAVSAILMIIAVVLCGTLAVVSFFVGPDGGAHVAAAVSATFDVYDLFKGLADSSYSASLVRSMCQDLCLGCGIIGTVASYTK